VRDTLLAMFQAVTVPQTGETDRDAHYEDLLNQLDPASTFEREVLDTLYRGGYRLPDYGQYRPTDEVYVQVDFFYERQGRPGVCVFVDGPDHDQPEQSERDRGIRAELHDLGFRIVAIRHDRPIEEQIQDASDVFGS
jgi:hypothetical protein